MPGWIIQQRSIAVSLVALPIALSIGYLYRLNKRIEEATSAPQSGRHTASAASLETSSSELLEPKSLPDDVKDDPSRWMVCYERVSSTPMHASALAYPIDATANTSPSALLLAYLRAVHVAFSWTPQALLMRAMIKEPGLKQTFDKTHISNLSFTPRDIVNGLYKVSHHERDAKLGTERVELLIDPPASFKGPTLRGILVAAVERSSNKEEVVFVNETWMWRTVDEPPTLLECPGGKWFHSKLAGWLVVNGLRGNLKEGVVDEETQ